MGMPDYFLLLCICKRLPIMGESGDVYKRQFITCRSNIFCQYALNSHPLYTLQLISRISINILAQFQRIIH